MILCYSEKSVYVDLAPLTSLVCVIFSSELSAVELDDEGGRTFLRVLIHLIMQDYPPLVSGSLQLIFKHFSQRAEVLQAFKQVSTARSGCLTVADRSDPCRGQCDRCGRERFLRGARNCLESFSSCDPAVAQAPGLATS